jgi:hypothetical protein
MPNVVKSHRRSITKRRFPNGNKHYDFQVLAMDWTRSNDDVYWSDLLGQPGNVITITNHNFEGEIHESFEHIVLTCAHKSIPLPIYHFGWIPGAHPLPVQEIRSLERGEFPIEIIYRTFNVF